MKNNYEEILKQLVENDERFIVMTAENRAAIRNLSNQINKRFIDVGIAEQTMVGMAAGLALRGRIPIIHALATFLTMRAFEFIRTDVGIPNLTVKLIGGVPGLLSDGNGPTHQAIEDISLMRSIPNMNIFCPADEDDLLKCIEQILKYPSPFYVRFNNIKPSYNHTEDFEIGKAEIISKGNDITILTYGLLFSESLIAKSILEKQGFSVGLINLRTLKPIDEKLILNCAETSSILVTIEDHFITGGLFSIVSELLVKNNILIDVIPISLGNNFFKPALLNDVLKCEKLRGEDIAEKIINQIHTKNKFLSEYYY